MPRLDRPLDKDGFPLPPRYEELTGRDDFATFGRDRQGSEPGAGSPLWRRLSGRSWKVLVALILFAIIAGPELYRFTRRTASDWLFQRARHKVAQEDYAGAEADLTWAISWQDEDPRLYTMRAHCREELRDLKGSYDDLSEVVIRQPSDSEGYLRRAWVQSRRAQHREAIEDASRAVALEKASPHLALNQRAYIRALANLELPEALQDIEKALRQSPEEPAYLDTRGYIHYLLGDYKKAEADLDAALAAAVETRRHTLARARQFAPGRVARLERMFDGDIAVMYHHRGLVKQKLGNTQAAASDFAQAEKLGFDPETNVR